ncbi:hypothetical protein OC844_004824 [Tilletia horrida]|nr:hypothetical protein OC844_004824 [Tilletia horrida]
MDEFGEQHFRLTDANAAGALWAKSTAFSPFIVPLRQGGSVQVLGVLYKPVSVVYTDGVTCTSGPPPSDTPTIFQPSTQFHEHGGLNMHKTEQQEAPRFAPHVTASLPGHARRQQGFVCPAHIHGNVGDDASIANGNDTPSGHMLKSAKTLPHDASDDGDSGDVDEQEKDGETEEHEQENGKGIDEDDEMTFMCADGEALGNTDEDSRKNSAPLSSTAAPYSDEHAGSQPGRDSTYTAGSSAAAALHHADIADHDFSEALRAIMDASDQEIETAMLAVFNRE